MANWTISEIPLLRGRRAVVTGTGGLGLEVSLVLAQAGAEVVIAGRNAEKGRSAVESVQARVSDANVRFEVLDLASLVSVESFASRLREGWDGLELLVNNAAVMTPPRKGQTEDGLELQLGTNYLGHFALTGRLLPLLRTGRSSRVVSVSSVAARDGSIHFGDLQSDLTYKPMAAYSQSKLACLMFALELHRRSEAAGWGVSSLAAHPGISRTELIPNGAGEDSLAGCARKHLWFLFQPAAQGALPILYAATSPEAVAGGYYGPDKLMETRGYPAAARLPRQAQDTAVAERLWKVSEELTGVPFPEVPLAGSSPSSGGARWGDSV